MTVDECRIWRERLGAFALGQLSDSERAATEAHLEGCPDCRAEANALSPMAAMLERADPDRLSPAPAARSSAFALCASGDNRLSPRTCSTLRVPAFRSACSSGERDSSDNRCEMTACEIPRRLAVLL